MNLLIKEIKEKNQNISVQKTLSTRICNDLNNLIGINQRILSNTTLFHSSHKKWLFNKWRYDQSLLLCFGILPKDLFCLIFGLFDLVEVVLLVLWLIYCIVSHYFLFVLPYYRSARSFILGNWTIFIMLTVFQIYFLNYLTNFLTFRCYVTTASIEFQLLFSQLLNLLLNHLIILIDLIMLIIWITLRPWIIYLTILYVCNMWMLFLFFFLGRIFLLNFNTTSLLNINISQIIDINFTWLNALNNIFFYLFDILISCSFYLYLMRCNNLHFVFIHLFISFLFHWLYLLWFNTH